ncbi:MAG: hypothetical protein JKY22_02230 [Flavobacteriaceae bacterium]|nr:hypothetical protein [Flavobacteriaceae bacterium]
MKIVLLACVVVFLSAFTMKTETQATSKQLVTETAAFASFSLVNDTKEKVSIHTGSGFVSLSKGSKTSITCKTGKEVRWAESGKKKDVIFEITSEMCGKTIKLSEFL